MQQHQIKLTLILHKIQLNVKFPCSVSANLKIESQQQPLSGQSTLNNGQANFQVKHSATLPVQYNSRTKVYRQKKILLLIYLKSSSGRIPAGNVTIDLNSIKKGVNKIQTNITKCPDKSASIFFSIAIQTLSQTNLKAKQQQNDYRPSYKNLSTPRSQYVSADRKSLHSQNELYQSKVSSKDERQSQGGYSTRLSQFIMRNKEDQIDQQRKKIRQLQKQKAEAMKEVRSMKNSVRVSGQRQKSNESRHKIRQLQKQLQSEKDKTSNYELQLTKRSHKQTQLQKDYKALSKKYEQLKLDYATMTNKKQTFQKSAKQLECQYKIVKEKYEDSLLANQNNTKRSDFKENVLKEQIKILNQKFSSSQSQKQRLILQKNDIIMEFQQRQRASRLGFKQKQKTFNQQKNKLSKKIDSLSKQFQQGHELKKQLQAKLAQVIKQNKALQLQIQNLEISLEEARTQINDLQIRFGSQQDKKRQKQKTDNLLKTYEEYKKKSRKTFQQKDQQIAKSQKLITNYEASQQKLSKKIQQLEHSLKQKTAANKILQREYDVIIKQNETIKKQSKVQQKKLQDITFSKQNETSKFTNLNQELRDAQKKHFQEIKNMNNLLMEKQALIVKLKVQIDQANYQQNIFNKRLQELEKQLQEMSTQINHKYIENQNLIAEVDELKQKLGDLQQKSSKQSNTINELQRANEFAIIQNSNALRAANEKISILERQLEQISSTSSQELVEVSLRYQKIEANLRSRQQQIQDLNNKITDLQTIRVRNEADLSEQEYQIRMKTNQINFLKQQLDISRKQFSQLDQQCKLLSIHLQQKQQEIFMLKQNNQTLSAQNLNKDNTSIKYLQQFENFKLNNMNCLRVFFSAINSQQNIQLSTLVNHEEDQINRLIKQSIANKNAYIKAMTKQVKRLQSACIDLQQTIKSLNKQNIEKTKLVQKLQKNTKSIQQKASQNSTSLQQICTQLKLEIQQRNKKIIQLQELVKQLKKQVQKMKSTLGHTQQLKNSQIKKLQSLEQNYAVFKLSKQGELRQKQSQFRQKTIQLNKLTLQLQKINRISQQNNNTISNLEQKNIELTKNLKEQRINLKNISKELQDKKNQIEKFNKQLAGVKSELQIKKQTIVKNGLLEQQLRNNIKIAQEENKNLKEQNVKISKINQKTITKEKQLEQTLNNAKKSNVSLNDKVNELQKSFKQKQAQITNLKETIYNLQQQKNKATRQNQTTMRIKKLHEDEVIKLENIIKNMKGENQKLLQRIKEDGRNFKLKQAETKKQLKELSTQKDHHEQESKEYKKKFQTLQQNAKKENSKILNQSQNLKKDYHKSTIELTQNKNKVKELQNKMNNIMKQMEVLQKSNNLQANYIKPIKQEIASLKQLFSLEHKFIDQFQINKNKLVKMGHYKLDTYSQKYSFEIIKEISISLQKCKAQIISRVSTNSSSNINGQKQKQKLQMIQQFSKVQKVIDKFNRADIR